MRENRTSGSMSGSRKRSEAPPPPPPRRLSTLPECLLRAANDSNLSRFSQIVLLNVAQLRLRRPISEKRNISQPFAALATKLGEKYGLDC